MPPPLLRILLVVGGLGLAASAGADVPQASPFQQPYRLTGATGTAASAKVYLMSVKDRHGQWIAVGATANGIQVESYDAAARQAVVVYGGSRHVLPLEDEPAAAATAADAAQARRDDRMLVTDLLVIGQQQRQANAAPPAAAK